MSFIDDQLFRFKELIEDAIICGGAKGKESITGYQYEPWHIRYVGVEHATKIMNQNITLEEYLNA